MDSVANPSLKLPRSTFRLWIKENKSGYLFILPAFLLYSLFFIYPFLQSVFISMTNWNGVDATKTFIGPENYLDMFSDRLMWASLTHNLIWVIIGTAAPIVIGLLLAVLLSSEKTKGRIFFRVILRLLQ